MFVLLTNFIKMKQKTDNRINNAKSVSKDDLICEVKAFDPIRFDQMLIGSEERKTYFYVNYKSMTFERKPKTLNFPLFSDLVTDFERDIESTGEIQILKNDRIIQKVLEKGNFPIDTKKYSGKNLIFSELDIITENDIVKLNQPFYYIPGETERCTCNTCKGGGYTTCKETECKGQHIYDCNKCDATGEITCEECQGDGESNCPSCKGKGYLKCKGYVGAGSGGAVSNAVYSCRNGKAQCDSCSGNGFTTKGGRCSKRCEKGWLTCPTCNGQGEVPCKLKYASSYGIGKAFDFVTDKKFCEGSGKVNCKNCDASGQVTCSKCDGDRELTCNTCYGDYTDDRYGKVDCKTCDTAGELASISYIETEIRSDNLELICTDGKIIDAPNFGVETIKKYCNPNSPTVLTYKNLNGQNNEAYDEYSLIGSKRAMTQLGISKDKYPKMLVEELYIEGVPCATYDYNHILSATFHDVSILGIDNEKDVLFHSDPNAIAEETESFNDKLTELCRKAFSTKLFKDKTDRKHEMFLMIHMAKADGIIEEQEKVYLAQTITGLDGFTNKEKAALFGLMSSSVLPPISPLNSYFSNKERAEVTRKKIVELVAKADGEYEELEKEKITEINSAIELGYKAKPSAVGQFFKTWQISMPLITLFFSVIGLVTFFIFFADSSVTLDKSGNSIVVNSSKTVPKDSENLVNKSSVFSQPKETVINNSIQEDSSTVKDENEIIGNWTGTFGNNKLLISIESINDDGTVTGYNMVKNNRRDLAGYKKGDDFELKEPGDDKWDGVFKFKLTDNQLIGTWTANNGKSTKNFILTK